MTDSATDRRTNENSSYFSNKKSSLNKMSNSTTNRSTNEIEANFSMLKGVVSDIVVETQSSNNTLMLEICAIFYKISKFKSLLN
ncbi:hypothetical protein Csa_018461 [Cucumis sativus]|uniref:Uncharacterized protein n=1 Tax=Cucumis sativus TaxID=3659 RepID=A0A0A0KIW4_CUCSA|nr:hypothetical protein Csa_018461 [Cucumis sativus]